MISRLIYGPCRIKLILYKKVTLSLLFFKTSLQRKNWPSTFRHTLLSGLYDLHICTTLFFYSHEKLDLPWLSKKLTRDRGAPSHPLSSTAGQTATVATLPVAAGTGNNLPASAILHTWPGPDGLINSPQPDWGSRSSASNSEIGFPLRLYRVIFRSGPTHTLCPPSAPFSHHIFNAYPACQIWGNPHNERWQPFSREITTLEALGSWPVLIAVAGALSF